VIVVLPAGWLRMIVARVDLRDHRKIAVFDERIAYTGSFNLADPAHFKRDAGFGQWIDAMVRVQGPACATLASISDAMASLQLRTPLPESVHRQPAEPAGHVALQPYPSGPGFAYRHVESVILTAIYSARTEISITTPYFAPGESVITALRSAARRGVDVTVLLPMRCDSRLVQQASAAYFDELLLAGVRIERFNGGLLHTKSMVIDRTMSMFGTLNFDLRSFHLNFEVSVLVYDRDFAAELLALQRSYLADCERLELLRWRQRPYWRRMVENAAHLASPLL
jgi:cardiolipin synthase A/B